MSPHPRFRVISMFNVGDWFLSQFRIVLLLIPCMLAKNFIVATLMISDANTACRIILHSK